MSEDGAFGMDNFELLLEGGYRGVKAAKAIKVHIYIRKNKEGQYILSVPI